MIEKTGGGLLVNPADPADLARGLQEMLANHALREEMGRKGKQAVHEHFTAPKMARETLAVYQRYLL